jgi:hypothetical protein
LSACVQGEVSGPLKIKIASVRRWPFQILEKINDNVYKIDLLGEYDVNATFNIFDLFLFDVVDDLKLNPFEERVDDTD